MCGVVREMAPGNPSPYCKEKLENSVIRIISVLAILGLTLNVASIAASAQTTEDALASIEKNFAQMQITKDPRTIEAVSMVMADDFYSFNPTHGFRRAKRQLLEAIASPKYVVTSMDFPPFFIHVYGSTAIVEGTNTSKSHVGRPGCRRQLRMV
jgi:hypothetical protein